MRAISRTGFRSFLLPTHTNASVRLSCTALVIVLSTLGCAGRSVAVAQSATIVLLVRHAERASQDGNANLSPEGSARAEDLAGIARTLGVSVIYTTDLCRTAQTGHPAAVALGAPLRIVATGSSAAGLDSCTPPIVASRQTAGDLSAEDLAKKILADHAGRTVLVVGHSNTVPALMGALLGASACPGPIPLEAGRCVLPEDAYGDLFVVRVASGDVGVEHRRFGN
jgi:phosphohistidine phosphatase SixA